VRGFHDSNQDQERLYRFRLAVIILSSGNKAANSDYPREAFFSMEETAEVSLVNL
jgi:hypothetical protein